MLTSTRTASRINLPNLWRRITQVGLLLRSKSFCPPDVGNMAPRNFFVNK